jgi:hypothetical protein
MMAAVLSIGLGAAEEKELIGDAWRAMFVVGVLPALLSLFIFRKLHEPEKWVAAAAQRRAEREAGLPETGPKLGSITELFGDPRWRKNTIVGMLLAFSGVVGLWGIGFFSFDLFRTIFKPHFTGLGEARGLVGVELDKYVDGSLTFWTGITSLLQNLGGFFGIYAFSRVTTHIGRKPAFAISFILALGATVWVYWTLDSFYDVFWKIPIMGFCQLTLFGGYAIYFPELFPTRLRSTGTSFCYNVGRLVAAAGPLTLGLMTSEVFKGYKAIDPALPYRYAGVTMCLVFLVGLIALPFAPETRGKPLPE